MAFTQPSMNLSTNLPSIISEQDTMRLNIQRLSFWRIKRGLHSMNSFTMPRQKMTTTSRHALLPATCREQNSGNGLCLPLIGFPLLASPRLHQGPVWISHTAGTTLEMHSQAFRVDAFLPGQGHFTPATFGRAESDRGEDGVQRLAGAEGGVCLGIIRQVVTADIGGLALHGEEFADDGFLVGSERFCDGSEGGLEFGILVLRGERLGPIEGEIEMRAAVVDGAEFATG